MIGGYCTNVHVEYRLLSAPQSFDSLLEFQGWEIPCLVIRLSKSFRGGVRPHVFHRSRCNLLIRIPGICADLYSARQRRV